MATNKLRGRVEVRKADGETFTLQFGFDAIKALEELFGVSGWKALGEKCDAARAEWSQEQMLEVFRIGLRRHHPQVADDAAAIEELAFQSEKGLLVPCLEAVIAAGSQIVYGGEQQQKPAEVGQAPPPKTSRTPRVGKSS
jgi:hypothetical protein